MADPRAPVVDKAVKDLEASRGHLKNRFLDTQRQLKAKRISSDQAQQQMRVAWKTVMRPALERFFAVLRSMPPGTENVKELLLSEYMDAAGMADHLSLPAALRDGFMTDAREVANGHCRLLVARLRRGWSAATFVQLSLALLDAQMVGADSCPDVKEAQKMTDEFGTQYMP